MTRKGRPTKTAAERGEKKRAAPKKRAGAATQKALAKASGTRKKKSEARGQKSEVGSQESEESTVPVPPTWLGTVARDKWRELAPTLFKHGLLTDLDHDSFASFCDAFQELVDSTATLKKEGEYFTTEKGWIAQHPAVFKRNKALERLRRMGVELGLTPQSRRNLDVAAQEVEADPLLKFLERRPA
jgi:P27 family predicted phage terminase small subunit